MTRLLSLNQLRAFVFTENQYGVFHTDSTDYIGTVCGRLVKRHEVIAWEGKVNMYPKPSTKCDRDSIQPFHNDVRDFFSYLPTTSSGSHLFSDFPPLFWRDISDKKVMRTNSLYVKAQEI